MQPNISQNAVTMQSKCIQNAVKIQLVLFSLVYKIFDVFITFLFLVFQAEESEIVNDQNVRPCLSIPEQNTQKVES